jgi:hypothetical protein
MMDTVADDGTGHRQSFLSTSSSSCNDIDNYHEDFTIQSNLFIQDGASSSREVKADDSLIEFFDLGWCQFRGFDSLKYCIKSYAKAHDGDLDIIRPNGCSVKLVCNVRGCNFHLVFTKSYDNILKEKIFRIKNKRDDFTQYYHNGGQHFKLRADGKLITAPPYAVAAGGILPPVMKLNDEAKQGRPLFARPAAEEISVGQSNPTSNNRNYHVEAPTSRNITKSTSAPNCVCNLPASLQTVRSRNNNNQGLHFYGCSRYGRR